MSLQILIKRGLSTGLDSLTLAAGELAFTTDTKKLYIGNASGGKEEVGGNSDVLNNLIDGLGTASNKDVGIAEGEVPVLGAGGKLPESMLPAIAITDVFEVESQVAMLALEVQQGDVAVRSDLNKSFILKAAPASTLENWVELRTPTDTVISVNGKVGTVSLGAADVGLGNVDNTSDADKPVSTAAQAALDLKAPLASPALTGSPTAPTADTTDNSTKIATTAYVKAQNYIADGDVIDGGTF